VQDHNISIYTVPIDSDEDENFKANLEQIRASIPFAIVSSTDKNQRQYPFGTVQCDLPEHSDFVKLRSLLVSNMQDLRESTNDLYENYRSSKLAARNSDTQSIGTLLDDGMEVDKDQILKEKEAELAKMQEMIKKMQEQISQRG